MSTQPTGPDRTCPFAVPLIRGLSLFEASLAYANAGWFVLPVLASTKHAGSFLGKGWPDKTSQDPRQLRAWFSNPGLGLALHVGRSGAVVFDVDDPNKLPDVLSEALQATQPPFQSTRNQTPGRGHYAFLQPIGADLGNSKGRLVGKWGEVRGKNGVIVVEPSQHEKCSSGGRYVWMSSGPLPVLPDALMEALRGNDVHQSSYPGTSPIRVRSANFAAQLRAVRSAAPGARNQTLFQASCRAGELVRLGRLTERQAVEVLTTAGSAAGLGRPEMVGYGGRSGTIYSGLRTGPTGSFRRARR